MWLNLLGFLDQTGLTLSSLKMVVIGGAAPPRSMIEAFEKRCAAGACDAL